MLINPNIFADLAIIFSASLKLEIFEMMKFLAQKHIWKIYPPSFDKLISILAQQKNSKYVS